MLYTTFRLAREAEACKESYRRFAKHVGGIRLYGITTPIQLTEILDVLGIEDALWCLRCTTEDSSKVSRLLMCDYAERVLPIFEGQRLGDRRPRNAIDTARRYANGLPTEKELDAARAAARDAAWAARDAAWAAAEATAGDAAWAAWAAEKQWQVAKLREYLIN